MTKSSFSTLNRAALLGSALAGSLALAASSAFAQDLTISGFMEFEAHYGENYDLEDSEVDSLDFATDGRLNFDYSNATKSGLAWGMHLELDLQGSDDAGIQLPGDVVDGDAVEFNDGYVFVNSALGNIKMGDTGDAAGTSNQLNVPILPLGAIERDHFSVLEAEQVFYANSFYGVDFEASVDDDSNWSVGVSYAAPMGPVMVALGLTAQDQALAGSLGASIGGLSAGVNYAMEEFGASSEYIAAGIGYDMGALHLGLGVETEIAHMMVVGETYTSNVFAGATYELADGLTLGAAIGSLDNDSVWNWNGANTAREISAITSVKVEF